MWTPIWECKRVIHRMVPGDPPQPEDDLGVAPAEVEVTEVSEWINITQLIHDLADGTITRKRHMVDALLRAYRDVERRGNFGVLVAKYFRKHGIAGRWYAKGPSVQSYLSKFARASGFHIEHGSSAGANTIFIDIDISNCYVTILCNLLLDELNDLSDFNALISLRDHYQVWRSFLA